MIEGYNKGGGVIFFLGLHIAYCDYYFLETGCKVKIGGSHNTNQLFCCGFFRGSPVALLRESNGRKTE